MMARRDRSILDDNLLVEQLSGPDWAEALATLWDRHMGLLWNAARTVCSSDADAEDAIWDAHLRLAERAAEGTLEVHSSFRALAATVVRNVALGRIRKTMRLDLSDTPIDETMADAGPLPADRFVDNADSAMMAAAFASLTEQQRMVMFLTAVEDFGPSELAEVLDVKANTASQTAVRCRQALRTAYVEQHLTITPTDELCAEVQRLFPAWITNKLGKRETTKVNDHLGTCSACRAVLDDLEDDTRKLRGLFIPPIVGLLGVGTWLLRSKPASALSAEGGTSNETIAESAGQPFRTLGAQSARSISWTSWPVVAATSLVVVAAIIVGVALVLPDDPPKSESAAEITGVATTVTAVPVTTTTLSPEQQRDKDTAEIIAAVENAFNGQLPVDVRMTTVRDGAALIPTVEAARARNPQIVGSVRAAVSNVVIDSDAKGTYTAQLTSAIGASTLPGSAVRVDGKWLVSRFTVCSAVQILGVQCPPDTTRFPIDETVVVPPTGGATPDFGAMVANSGFVSVTANGVTSSGPAYLMQNCPASATATVFVEYRDGQRGEAVINLTIGVPTVVNIAGREVMFWYDQRGAFCRSGSGNPGPMPP